MTDSVIRQLKNKDIAEYRQQQLIEQDYCCALCGELIEDDAVLDHDHRTGYIRGVLHRGCNALEGKISRSLAINKITRERLETILDRYMFYVNQHHLVLHPTHKTPEQRRARANKLAKQRRIKAKGAQ